ncbi:1-acylglycerol-3-phosphate O-acyltransferase [Candidatus Schneideria nysicola]|uniref:1-acylglycerol-3-phosphate O-acyltransferase n=1 Tax=Candidatus Schneideria nysicola TaxID=1081631 RepID=UPI001CAA7A3B|nr:1-acylglycerol-3-phosphate O-acyltransferase [Candidatus Schneideria nysicola]UAJ66065.1 1-acylglycerol-3-phosphate O-acyltransferase [Candidatus Schneideria nysicola]
MLIIIRIILIIITSIFICIFGLIYCLFRPRYPAHSAKFSHFFGKMTPILGIKIDLRLTQKEILSQNCIYIANHQNNYDLIIAANVVQPRTIAVGKSSLLFVPFLGWLYWLSGNIFINRNNPIHSYNLLLSIVKKIKEKNLSLWIFPEATRSRGRGLLPFKRSIFKIAIICQVPIVPICISDTNKIQLNRWNNGLVIVEILPPIRTNTLTIQQVNMLTDHCHNIIKNKVNQLNKEVHLKEKKVTKI